MILALNTAEERLQILLVDGGGLRGLFEEDCPGRMNEIMAPEAARMLAAAPAPLEGVACVRGPGSFTGVRLGLAYAHGLCLARSLPLAGLDYLPLLAACGREEAPGCEMHVLTHSRTARVYHQGFDPCGAPLAPAQDLPAQAAAQLVRQRAATGPVAVLGSGLRRNPAHFEDLGPALRLGLIDPTPPALAQAALTQAARGAAFTGPPVDALYLRGSDAEENLAAIAAGRGLTPEEAQARLERALSG
ncbi:tRNA (adenosine(37)-N6)-threonylcarbamoyltransferase complex dimerization subunit type 1 TsaB [Fundidesulfovibrio soli]|uniref:tRNA (adenosine(37)-N6)-threonylcarbamoyltransferase complex dimerization subunit type 1 TsaB n=1 Tax=Fundidesulfovibrio soli TaxID=2922716 RepID=UPI001FAF9E58|nr:tRNA (adenosine(37)-N6)-threonylcarbamoyltransferase complex dimerization subunit type 1 TsaB [Fundidesulfovibrio soli]